MEENEKFTEHEKSMLLQLRIDVYKDNNVHAMKTAQFALNAAFLLNGAASTTLFAKAMIWPAVLCGLGAVSSVVSMGLSYVTILLLGETWRPGSERGTKYKFFKFELDKSKCESMRFICLFLWMISILLFISGATLAVCYI